MAAARRVAVKDSPPRQLPLGLRLPDKALFASYLPARNGEAVAHLARLAAGYGGTLTWLSGPEGAGKTHLLQATCAAAGERVRAGYLPLAEVAALGAGVLEGLTELDLLCVDDLERVVGEAHWERGLFGVLCEMEDTGARMLLAARSPPALLPWGLADLGSRCAAAAVFQLRGLDEGEQQAALRLRARLRGVELPDETLAWLQRRFPRDMRSLYMLLDELDEASLAAQRRLTIPFIREVLRSRG
jgi:DnaA family protein